MKWIKTPPTKQGWYWFKDEEEIVKIVHVVEMLNGSFNVRYGDRWKSMASYVMCKKCQWAGPIEKPEE